MCQAVRSTVCKYFSNFFIVCLFLSILLPNESIVYLCFLYHMIYAHIFSGVKSLNSVFPRIVDPKCENEFIDTS